MSEEVQGDEAGAAVRRQRFEEQAGAASAEPDDAFPLRYCKKCKAAFMSAKCPGGHPNFLYSSKIPGMDVETVLAKAGSAAEVNRIAAEQLAAAQRAAEEAAAAKLREEAEAEAKRLAEEKAAREEEERIKALNVMYCKKCKKVGPNPGTCKCPVFMKTKTLPDFEKEAREKAAAEKAAAERAAEEARAAAELEAAERAAEEERAADEMKTSIAVNDLTATTESISEGQPPPTGPIQTTSSAFVEDDSEDDDGGPADIWTRPAASARCRAEFGSPGRPRFRGTTASDGGSAGA